MGYFTRWIRTAVLAAGLAGYVSLCVGCTHLDYIDIGQWVLEQGSKIGEQEEVDK